MDGTLVMRAAVKTQSDENKKANPLASLLGGLFSKSNLRQPKKDPSGKNFFDCSAKNIDGK